MSKLARWTIPKERVESFGSFFKPYSKEVRAFGQYGLWIVHRDFTDAGFAVSHVDVGYKCPPVFRLLCNAVGCAKDLAALPIQFYSLQDPAWKMTRRECGDIVWKWDKLDKIRNQEQL
jgi:hypothetical protein